MITIMQVLKAVFIGIYGSIIMTLYYKLSFNFFNIFPHVI